MEYPENCILIECVSLTSEIIIIINFPFFFFSSEYIERIKPLKTETSNITTPTKQTGFSSVYTAHAASTAVIHELYAHNMKAVERRKITHTGLCHHGSCLLSTIQKQISNARIVCLFSFLRSFMLD